MPYFQNRFLNPKEPRYDWCDALAKQACARQEPPFIPPLPTVWPENVDLWAAAWPNGLPQAGASSFDGRVPSSPDVYWTTKRGDGLGALLPFAEIGEAFDFIKVGVIVVGLGIGGYIAGYLWRELRTPRATNRRKRRRNGSRGEAGLRRMTEAKKALDVLLEGAPDGHRFSVRSLPARLRKPLVHLQAVGASFGNKVLLRDKEAPGFYFIATRRRNTGLRLTASKYPAWQQIPLSLQKWRRRPSGALVWSGRSGRAKGLRIELEQLGPSAISAYVTYPGLGGSLGTFKTVHAAQTAAIEFVRNRIG